MLALALTAALLANFPGDNGRIAFHSTFGCQGTAIATIRTDGTGLRRLTANPCNGDSPQAIFPDWAANGQRIAYVGFVQGDRAESAIVVAEADGGGEQVLERALRH